VSSRGWNQNNVAAAAQRFFWREPRVAVWAQSIARIGDLLDAALRWPGCPGAGDELALRPSPL
jgi:hypothetical protein